MVQKPLEHFTKHEIQVNLKTNSLLQSFELSLMSELFFFFKLCRDIALELLAATSKC